MDTRTICDHCVETIQRAVTTRTIPSAAHAGVQVIDKLDLCPACQQKVETQILPAFLHHLRQRGRFLSDKNRR